MRRRRFLQLASGAAVSWPLSVDGQTARTPLIGVLASTRQNEPNMHALYDGLRETGYVEGRNLTVLFRSADGDFDRLPEMATDLINRNVALIIALASPVPARVAKAATSTIPIVFAYGGDPAADNLVSNFNRPEGNVTGATFISAILTTKRLELLNEIVPKLTDVAILVNPKGTLAESQITETLEVAKKTGQRIHVLKASKADEIDAAFAEIDRSGAKGLLVSVDPTLAIPLRGQIIALAASHKVPAVYGNLPFSKDGGLVTYGVDGGAAWRQAGVYAGRLLNGEKPSDLPVIQPTKFELIVNLKAAKALGLVISEAFLLRADEVIE